MNEHERQMSQAILDLLQATRRYTQAYKRRFEGELVGDNYVLGPYVADVLRGAHGLLVGPTGTVDCGATASAILAIARENGLLDDNGEIQR